MERWDGYQILPELVKALRSASTRGPERRAKLTAPEAKAGSFRPWKFREETILGAAGNFYTWAAMWSNVHFKATPDHGRGNAFEEQEQK